MIELNRYVIINGDKLSASNVYALVLDTWTGQVRREEIKQ